MAWRFQPHPWDAIAVAEVDAPYHVLFLCTGNSARSILAECALNRMGDGRFRAFSAGSHPKPAPHPTALALLREEGFETENLRSKSWDEFAVSDAPRIDLVVTVCDDARNETCPVWPGHPRTTHWGLADPAAVAGSPAAQHLAFCDAWDALCARVGAFLRVPLEYLEPRDQQRRLDEIGSIGG